VDRNEQRAGAGALERPSVLSRFQQSRLCMVADRGITGGCNDRGDLAPEAALVLGKLIYSIMSIEN